MQGTTGGGGRFTMEGHVLKEEKCQYEVRFCSNSLTGREGSARLEVKGQMEVRVTAQGSLVQSRTSNGLWFELLS